MGKDHCLTHLSEKEKEQYKITCPFPGCDYSALAKELLDSHVKNIHEEQEKVPCTECNKIFKNAKTLRDHFRIMHKGTERRKFVCDDCGKTFLYKKYFNEHSLTHLTEEEKEKYKIPCQYSGCDYTTMIKELMVSHIKNKHEEHEKATCMECNKVFK